MLIQKTKFTKNEDSNIMEQYVYVIFQTKEASALLHNKENLFP